MNIPNEQLEEFKRIYTREFGKELSDEEAYEQLIKVVRLVAIAYKHVFSPKQSG